MAAAGISPGVIATIVVILIVALVFIVFYFVCRSDDPARDHTCVALLYPRSRKELQQLRIPLDPTNPTDVHVNPAFEDEKQEKEEHSVEINDTRGHTDRAAEQGKNAVASGTRDERRANDTTGSPAAKSGDDTTSKGFCTVELQPVTVDERSSLPQQ